MQRCDLTNVCRHNANIRLCRNTLVDQFDRLFLQGKLDDSTETLKADLCERTRHILRRLAVHHSLIHRQGDRIRNAFHYWLGRRHDIESSCKDQCPLIKHIWTRSEGEPTTVFCEIAVLQKVSIHSVGRTEPCPADISFIDSFKANVAFGKDGIADVVCSFISLFRVGLHIFISYVSITA